MKWTKKGHEFDELGERLKRIKSIYLFGAGIHGKTAYEKYHYKICIKGFIDNDKSKQGGELYGLPITSLADIKLLDDEAIILTAQPSSTRKISRQLDIKGYMDNVFPMQLFFPIFDFYKNGEICIPSISFLPTTVCNLNCKHCANFTPYIKNHQNRPLEKLIKDLDLLFSKIDTLLLFHISGGEPFTCPHLVELIDHISQSHKEKLGRLEMTTNGTIIPSEKLLKSMKNAELYLTVDDYRDALPQYRDKYTELINKLKEYGINYQILKADSWISLDSPNIDSKGLSKENLINYFCECDVHWQEYRDGKFWICAYASYAYVAEKEIAHPQDYFDISELNDNNKLELIEFRLGYSNKGYAEFCKRCSGYYNNTQSVPVAEQL